ncbi:MAG: DUF2809 domain-containing protein [Lysobacteraceae bacterium]|nr:MAG: DUF2809 domain-containing protein [Xanthomonadaceae bacterium]
MRFATPRSRAIALTAAFATVCAGLLSRKTELLLSTFGKYPGDALWSVMVYFLVAAAAPRLSRLVVATWAVVISFGVEFSQLLTMPWLRDFRATTIGHLMLGSTFNAPDLLAYAGGVALAFCMDTWLTRSAFYETDA